MPRPRPRLTLKKQPAQRRSRETVEAILQAATYILRRSGFDAMSTNQIAERAGVNIASLYQYFPNKHAIVVELVRRHAERTRRAVIPVLERMRGEEAVSGLRTMLEIVAAEHAIDPELHQIFTVLGPQLGIERVETEVDAVFAAAAASWARSMRGLLPDPELAMWIVRTAVHAVFHAAFVERPDAAGSPRLVDELVRLVTRYLEPVRGGRARARGRARAPKRELV